MILIQPVGLFSEEGCALSASEALVNWTGCCESAASESMLDSSSIHRQKPLQKLKLSSHAAASVSCTPDSDAVHILPRVDKLCVDSIVRVDLVCTLCVSVCRLSWEGVFSQLAQVTIFTNAQTVTIHPTVCEATLRVCAYKGPPSDVIMMLERSKYFRVQSGRWGGATRVAPPTPNSVGLYDKSYWCRPERAHSFVYDFVKCIWPYYRNIMR